MQTFLDALLICEGEIAAGRHPQVKPLSDEHFSMDRTLIEAWASQRV
jgi:hypothetical protein